MRTAIALLATALLLAGCEEDDKKFMAACIDAEFTAKQCAFLLAVHNQDADQSAALASVAISTGIAGSSVRR